MSSMSDLPKRETGIEPGCQTIMLGVGCIFMAIALAVVAGAIGSCLHH